VLLAVFLVSARAAHEVRAAELEVEVHRGGRLSFEV
jgi:hypothetical protein